MMNVVTRGVRNAFRNTIRTFSIVVILGISIGLALTMLVAKQSVESRIDKVKGSIGNTISISPAGVRGFSGGGELLNSGQLQSVSSIPHVSGVIATLSDRLTTSTSNLVSAVEAGSFGARAGGNSGVSFQGPPPDGGPSFSVGTGGETQQAVRSFTPPVIVTGVDNGDQASTYGGDSITFVSGKPLNFSSDNNDALVGKSLAEKNNLVLGSTFTMYDQTINVVGIYDTGNTFSNAGLVMSLSSVQRLSSQIGSVSNAVATVDSVDNMAATTTAVADQMGTSADVTSNLATAESAVAPLESVKTISTYSLIGSLIAGAIIILLTMMMIVRERRREIGVMKAIGSTNAKTMIQFIVESITLTVLGMFVGLGLAIVAANPVTQVLVNNSSSSSSSQPAGEIPGGRIQRRISIGGGINAIKDVQASVGADIIVYAVGSALLIAVLGSAVPAYFISKIRPADVMRAE